MKIQIVKLKMQNFKKHKDLTVDFTDCTDILGDNEVGKSTIRDAWRWLMYDCDTRGNKGAAAAKTTDGADFIHNLEQVVEADILMDGIPHTLKKSLTEIWTRKRQAAEQTYTGNTSNYWIDEKAFTFTQYTEFLNSIGPLQLLQCLTEPLYFSETLKWQERHAYIMEMSGGMSNSEVAKGDAKLEGMLTSANGENPSDFKKILQARITKTKEELDKLPIQINEQAKLVMDQDWTVLEKELSDAEEELAAIVAKENDATKAMEPMFNLRRQKADLEGKVFTEMRRLAEDANVDIRAKRQAVQTMEEKCRIFMQDIEAESRTSQNIKSSIEHIEEETEAYREEARQQLEVLKVARTEEMCIVPSSEFECPLCHHPLSEENRSLKMQQMLANFENEKKHKISILESSVESCRASGRRNNAKVEELRKDIGKCDTNIAGWYENLENLKKDLAVAKENLESGKTYAPTDFLDHADILALDGQIKELEAQIEGFVLPSSIDYAEMKSFVNFHIDEIKTVLYRRQVSDEAEKTIKAYEAAIKQKQIDQSVYEGLVYQCERFVKIKTQKMEGRINSMFSTVTFKLFKEQINGGQEETCEAIVNGTTFHDANTGGQINGGLDIINALMTFYGIQMPVFVDNLNLVTKPRQLDTQMIRMIVEEGSPLTIKNY